MFVEKEGLATATSAPIEARAEQTLAGETKLAEVELELVGGGALEGRVRASHGGEPAGWTVRATDGRGAIRIQTLAPDGLYRFEHLRPGGWQVRVFSPDTSRAVFANVTSPVEPVIDVLVVEFSVARLDLELPMQPALVGCLRFDGAPPGNWVARAGVPGRAAERQTLDPEGCFRARVVPGRESSLVLEHLAPDHSMTIVQKLAPGAALEAWSLDLPRGRVRGTWGRAEPSGIDRESLWIEWSGGDGTELRARVRPDEQGRFGPIPMPAGRVRFSAARGTGPRLRPSDRLPLGEVDVVAGVEASVDLP